MLLATCAFQAEAVTNGHSAHSTIALIGDSIALHLAEDLHDPDFNGPPDVTWSITSQAGAGWGEGQNAHGNWPLNIVQGNWAAKRVIAAARTRPSVIAIELGTNDALRNSLVFASDSLVTLAPRITGTETNISNVVKLGSSESRCVVLVTPTPSFYSPTTSSAESIYSEQAGIIRDELLKQASTAHGHSVVIADWGVFSWPHHLPSAETGSWFIKDGLHLNATGERALAALIVRTANTCK